jgi:uncharacterized protein
MDLETTAGTDYRAALRRRDAADAAASSARRERAWAVAGRAATLLRDAFGATDVAVFGSLVEDDGAWFGWGSDIDLAAWGVPAADYFMAVARLQDLSPEFSIDLVAMERCPEYLANAIQGSGRAL